MTTYTARLNHYSDKHPINTPLSAVLSDIQTGRYSDELVQYKSATDPGVKAKLKKALPAFSPSLELGTSSQLDASSKPTGIIQFDLDLKNNRDCDLDKIRNELVMIPELVYCFYSPSGGLKFALRTDFKSNPSDAPSILKQRFKQAYRLAKQHIITNTTCDFELDDCCKSIRQLCFVSDDENAYINLSCKSLKLNDDSKAPLASATESISGANESEIEQLLALVPQNLDWNDRLPVNFAVLHNIGENGIPLLLQHWNTEDKAKLQSDLNSQLEAVEYGDKGVLINWAKQHPDYQLVAPQTIRKEVSQHSDHKFDDFYTPEAASLKLDAIIDNFFETKKTTLVNISTGHGKTTSVLHALKKVPIGKQILFLTPNHKLAEEVLASYKGIKIETSENRLHDFRLRTEDLHRRAIHMKGKTSLCRDISKLEKFTDQGVSAPVEVCKNCTFFMNHDCDYIEQFSSMSTLRIMTHDQLWNRQSAWYYGHSGNNPKKGNRRPDYIIVDEDWLKDDHLRATTNSAYDSIRVIIGELITGTNLKEAITKHRDQLVKDHEAAKLVKFPSYSDDKNYVNDCIKANDQLADLPIVEALFRFVTTEDEAALSRLLFEKNELCLLRVKTPSARYEGVPVLYLDATADEKVIRAVLGDIDFHSIKVKPSEEINVYQAENLNVTKRWFGKHEKDLALLMETFKGYKNKYETVGVITYQSVNGVPEFDEWANEQKDQNKNYGFDEWVAEKCGLDRFGHFRDIRGSNQFKDVDCLIILGRHFLPLPAVPKYSQAIFGVKPLPKGNGKNEPTIGLPKPIRMRNGESRSLINLQYMDSNLQSVANHFCSAETKQAVGRGRLIWGTKKDIFVFSKESLDGDVEITDFFRAEDVIPIYGDHLKNLKKQGYCYVKAAELQKIGFSKTAAKRTNHERIKTELTKFEIEIIEVTYKDKSRHPQTREYLCSDIEKLHIHIEQMGGSAIEMRGLEVR